MLNVFHSKAKLVKRTSKLDFFFLRKGSTAYEIYPNQMAILWNTPGGFLWECQNIFTYSARTKNTFSELCWFWAPWNQLRGLYFALPYTASLPSTTTWDKSKEIGLVFNFVFFWDWDRDGEKMGKYELEHPSMDFLCHTMIRTVAPGVPLIYHIISWKL